MTKKLGALHLPHYRINDKEREQAVFKFHYLYPCIIVQNKIKVLKNRNKWYAGYVGIDENHLLYGITDNRVLEELLDVHGGITFISKGSSKDRIWNDQRLWYIGFDCSHAWDWDKKGEYLWTYVKVKEEVEKLARQLFNINNNFVSVLKLRLRTQSKEEILKFIEKALDKTIAEEL